jgi:hypothetical protein
MGSDTIVAAEARGAKGTVRFHFIKDSPFCSDYKLSVEEARHFRRRLSKAIRDADPPVANQEKPT